MKKNFTLLMGLLLMLTTAAWAQDKVKVEISREVDGEMQTFKKTYDSKEAMRDDEELSEFMGEDQKINFWFADDDHALSIDNIKKTQQLFFQMNDDEENNHAFSFVSSGDSAFAQQFEVQMRQLDEHMKELDINISEHLKDMQENMAIKIATGTNFNFAFGDSIQDAYVISLSDMMDDDKHKSRVEVIIKKTVKISDDTEEFGKKGKVSASNKLELEDLSYFPNPAPNGKFNLRFNTANEGELSIKIYNLDGKEVFNRYFETYGGLYSETIDLSRQSEGVYLLEIQMDGKRLTRKIAIN